MLTGCHRNIWLDSIHTGVILVALEVAFYNGKINTPLIVYADTTPNTELYTELHLENGFIPVNETVETKIYV